MTGGYVKFVVPIDSPAKETNTAKTIVKYDP
jgi:hypothetical protein